MFTVMPWMTREAHEAIVATLNARIIELAENWQGHATRIAENGQKEAERAEKRYAELLAKYHALRVQGANEPKPEPVAVPAEPLDPVVAAVNVACRGDSGLRAVMLQQAKREIQAGDTPEAVVMRIQRGYRPAEALR